MSQLALSMVINPGQQVPGPEEEDVLTDNSSAFHHSSGSEFLPVQDNAGSVSNGVNKIIVHANQKIHQIIIRIYCRYY